MPAAPQPVVTIRTSSSRFPTTRSALTSAARTTIAVPCWSSWKTGMSSSSRRRCSISKQRGAAMSSEIDPAEAGRDRQHRRHDRVDVLGRQAQREGVHAAEVLEEHRLALHHGQRGLGSDVAQPEYGRAVGDHGHHVLLGRERPGLLRIVGDRLRDAGDSRRVEPSRGLRGSSAASSRPPRSYRPHAAGTCDPKRSAPPVPSTVRIASTTVAKCASCLPRARSRRAPSSLARADEVDRAERCSGFAYRRGQPGKRARSILRCGLARWR